MDRFYDAEDNNIWLAFPSTDRNKVDIDDFLILKKGVGSITKDLETGTPKDAIKEKAQYKIIDIKNEAPDFIKRKETRIAYIRHTDGNKLFQDADLPAENDINFSIEWGRVQNSAYSALHKDFGKEPGIEYHITLSNTVTGRVSDRYKVSQLMGDDENQSAWYFTLEIPFNSEVNDFTDDNTGANVTAIKDHTFLSLYRTAVDKSALHKFDGRFFVKIYNDDIFAKSLKEPIGDVKTEYKSIGISRKIYSLKTIAGTNRIEKHGHDVVFQNIKTNLTSVGLNERVINKPNAVDLNDDDLFTWAEYDRITSQFGSQIGTLNNRNETENGVENDGLRDRHVWQDYDAYFRGINVDCGNGATAERLTNLDIHGDNSSDQKFQDVWFIDEAVSAANYHHSTISDKELGWTTFAKRFSWNSMGLYSHTNSSMIELAFGGIQPTRWSTDPNNNGIDTDESFFDLAGENYNYSDKEADFIEKIAIGSQFRWKEDPDDTIYTITDVDIVLRARYESLRNYAGIFTNLDRKDWDPTNKLRADQLLPFHVRALEGKAVGIRRGVGDSVWTNASGKVVPSGNWGGYTLFSLEYPNGIWVPGASEGSDGTGLAVTGKNIDTKVEALDNTAIWRTNTYLRPSNYTKNWRIKVDKSFNNHWNPVEDTNAEISNQLHIRLAASADAGHNYVEVSTANTGITGAGGNKSTLSVGMVLKEYDNAGGGTFTTLDPVAIVSEIEVLRDAQEVITGYRIYLKTEDGSDDFSC